MVLLTLLAAITVAIIRERSLFAIVILSSVYSFLMASVLIVLDAVDVAMTEASVGAGISTVVLLGTLYLTKTQEAPLAHSPTVPLIVTTITAGALLWGTQGLPKFGAANTPMHNHVGGDYLARSIPDTGVPNVVTTVLADYRSFDTLGETTVIFTAAIGVMLLLRGRRSKYDKGSRKAKALK